MAFNASSVHVMLTDPAGVFGPVRSTCVKAVELSDPLDAVPDELEAVQLTCDAGMAPPAGGVKLAASA